jgi:hypothetical protein
MQKPKFTVKTQSRQKSIAALNFRQIKQSKNIEEDREKRKYAALSHRKHN